MGILKKLFGSSSTRELKAIEPIVKKIEALEDEYRRLRTLTADYEARMGQEGVSP